jgi:hypothetical protein
MSRFGRIRRRPDHWASAHERARARAAERLDGPLGLAESTWLDAHLADCAECAAIAASYAADREALRAMRTSMPEPPRDLWARTAAAIEQESIARGRTPRTSPSRSRRVPLGALSGVAVVAVVVGVSVMSNLPFFSAGSAGTAAGDGSAYLLASQAPEAATDSSNGGGAVAQVEPTPIAVAAGQVRWVDLDRLSGSLAFNAANIEQVCPVDAEADCATLADGDAKRVTLDAAPETIIATPNDEQAIVVSRDAAGRQQLVVVDLPPVDAVSASASEPPDSEGPAGSPPPSENATAAPTDDLASPAPPASAEPTASATDDASAQPSPSPEVLPSATPEASQALELAIASDIEIIGESAAFSADGQWFAFTARPSGESSGSNVYVWKVGDATARPITTDDESTFASWDGDQVVVSRPGSTDTTGEPSSMRASASTLNVDPTTGVESETTTTWRPAIDPTGTHAVTWIGSLKAGEDGTFHPDEGSLELVTWPDGAREATSESVVDGAIGDFDVRWDETGDWFAVWTADPADPTLGRLSLFHVAEDGTLSRPEGAPAEVPALPGFSIGDGRLAWATPPGQGGEGSRVKIVAWKGDGVGRVETAPGEVLVVIR